MKVWVVYGQGHGTDVLGVFTMPERAAQYYADRYGGTPEDADIQGFDLWQFAPKKKSYWVATTEAYDGVPGDVVLVTQADVWSHFPIELPHDVAYSRVFYDTRLTTVQLHAWEQDGLGEHAAEVLAYLLNL